MVTGARLDERLGHHFLFVLVGIVYEAGAVAASPPGVRGSEAEEHPTASAGTRRWWGVWGTRCCFVVQKKKPPDPRGIQGLGWSLCSCAQKGISPSSSSGMDGGAPDVPADDSPRPPKNRTVTATTSNEARTEPSLPVQMGGPPVSGSGFKRPSMRTWRPFLRYSLQVSASRRQATTLTS